MSRPGAGRPFTGATLDRASVERKDPELVARLAASPSTRLIAAGRDGVLVTGDPDRPSLVRLEPTAAALEEPILLGLVDGEALFAVDLDREPQDLPAPGSVRGAVMSLREAGLALSQAEAGLAAYAAALLNWHRRHRFCANCGAETEIVEAGSERRCLRCATEHFPRTDPVVIMSVEHAGRLLLGRRAGGLTGFVSVLAGFISPGESAEEAVVREVQEESGIRCRDPRYVTSQPWPFPSSLMLGFHAIADGGEPTATDGELDEVRWVDAPTVRAAAAGEDVGFALPGRVSIARYLIERWVETQP